MSGRLAVLALVVVPAVGGCRSPLSEQAERVAKDWAMVLRASQMIPVYPMTEDLQPGDVFLVDVPIEEQAQRYEEDGYLPLDHHFARLPTPPYAALYADGYFEGDYAKVPHARPRPNELSETDEGEATDEAERAEARRFLDAAAPMASFPSYTFAVERGGGAEIGLPISGIPIALGLMRADSATVSVTIGDALTYGANVASLWTGLRAWASDPLVRAQLDQLAGQHGDDAGRPRLFLRVVSRVFLTGGVSVTVNRTDTGAADVGAGAQKEVELPELLTSGVPGTDAVSYRDNLEALSTTLTEALPGGRLKLGFASRSSVSLQEQFERPLVVGYLGFDVPVYAKGVLGAPVATRAVLLREAQIAPPVSELSTDQREYKLRRNELARATEGDEDEQARAVVLAAARKLPAEAFGAYLETHAESPAADAVKFFFVAADDYVADEGDAGMRYREVIYALDAAWNEEGGP